MFSILISAVITLILVVASQMSGAKTGTSVFVGIVGFLVAQYGIGFIVRKRVKKVQDELQAVMMEGQKRMNRKVQQFQTKPGGNYKMMQRQLEGDQKVLFKQALDFTENFEKFRAWSPMMGRQIATMKFQYNYQLKEFAEVDAILEKSGIFSGAMMMEPVQVAMKMARQYKNGDMAGLEKTFKQRIKWFRGSRGTLLYGLMSWALVKDGRAEEARELLNKGKDVTNNQALAHNWTQLSNGHVKNFTNAGLGEEWFALYLENPPAPKQQRIKQGGKRGQRMF
jgi:hypothetical protein